LILVSVPALAQTSQSTTEKPDELDTFVREYRKSTAKPGTSNPCKKVDTLAVLIDGAFDGQKNEVRMVRPLLTDPEDTIRDELTDCANGTRRPSEASEALRVSAIWERLRSGAFQKLYRDSIRSRRQHAPIWKGATT
jgi:hypothetical protein